MNFSLQFHYKIKIERRFSVGLVANFCMLIYSISTIDLFKEEAMQKKFGALRAIGTILKILGIIEAILAFAGMVTIIVISSVMGNVLTIGQFFVDLGGSAILLGIGVGLLFFFVTIIGAIGMYGMGGLIYLLIATEENTRATVIMLQSQVKQ